MTNVVLSMLGPKPFSCASVELRNDIPPAVETAATAVIRVPPVVDAGRIGRAVEHRLVHAAMIASSAVEALTKVDPLLNWTTLTLASVET